MTRRFLALSTCIIGLAACGGSPTAPAIDPAPSLAKAKPNPGYTAYVSGSTTNATTTPLGGALLAGGGTDSDAGMRWLLAQGGTRGTNLYGDVVVLRTSGSNGYNRYLMDFGANSVTSIVISTVTGANSAYVRDAIAKAEVVFLAGGDQSTYVNLWSGTALQTAVNARIAAGYPVGGTSAGLAVMGEYAYSALNASSTSATVLANPYDASVTFARSLFTVPLLANLITDSHFVTRDRLGRTVTFMARLQQDGWATSPRGIAVDEGSALGVTASGAGTVFGTGAGVYFFSVGTPVTRTCQANTALTFSPVVTYHVPVGKQFNVTSWTTADATAYTISATSGVLSSTTGSIY
ncbi:MAG: cyanophycinase [Gemmatimonadota bacterium]